MGFPGGAGGKEPACQCRRFKKRGLDPWVGKIPWRKVRQPTPVFLPGESHGQRSLAGCSPQVSQRVRHGCSDLACTSDILTALGIISMVHAHCLKQTLSQEWEISDM